MVNAQDRFLVYCALLIICSAVVAFLGPEAGLWTFLQMAAVTEVLHRLGTGARGNRAGHC